MVQMWNAFFVALWTISVTLGRSAAYLVKDGNCTLVSAKLPVVKNFQLEQYLGKWYELERYEQDYERNLECVSSEYKPSNTLGTIDMKTRGYSLKSEEFVSFNANAAFAEPPKEGVVDGKLNITYDFGRKVNNASSYWVVDTDYTTFSMVYSCSPIEETDLVIEGYWLLSRTPLLTDQLPIVERVKKLRSTYFELAHIKRTNQTAELCRKEPEPPVEPSSVILPPVP